jgi:hypothetical protein
MQRIFIMILLTAFLLFMLPAVAWAQGETPQVPIGDLFTWYTQDPPNYKNGILFLVLGAIGALATMYAAVGGVLPGTAGKDELDKQQRNLDVARQLENTYQQEVEALNKKPDLTPADENRLNRYREDVKDARGRADELEVRLNREKWKQFFIACLHSMCLLPPVGWWVCYRTSAGPHTSANHWSGMAYRLGIVSTDKAGHEHEQGDSGNATK